MAFDIKARFIFSGCWGKYTYSDGEQIEGKIIGANKDFVEILTHRNILHEVPRTAFVLVPLYFR